MFNANGIIASGLANAFAVSSFRLLPFFPRFEVDEKLQKNKNSLSFSPPWCFAPSTSPKPTNLSRPVRRVPRRLLLHGRGQDAVVLGPPDAHVDEDRDGGSDGHRLAHAARERGVLQRRLLVHQGGRRRGDPADDVRDQLHVRQQQPGVLVDQGVCFFG